MPRSRKLTLSKIIRYALRRTGQLCSDWVNVVITLCVQTHKSRWRKVSTNPEPHWDWRNRIISDLVPAGSSVLDVGCGAQTLRRHLNPTCKYQPCDLIKSTPDVIVCDFNAGLYPQVNQVFDYVICSGVLEYIRKPEEFLKTIAPLGRTLILSYSPAVPGQSRVHRLSCNWINHFTKAEVESLFDKVGIVWRVIYTHDQAETIYSLQLTAHEMSSPSGSVSPFAEPESSSMS